MAGNVQEIKGAIERRNLAAVKQWLKTKPKNINSLIIQSASNSNSPVRETPLQYAGRLGRPKIVQELISAGATVDVGLNVHTTVFNQAVPDFTHVLASCQKPITGPVSLQTAHRDLKAAFSRMDNPKGSIAQCILGAQEPIKSQREALWDVIQLFENELNAAGQAVAKANAARIEFLSNIALLSSNSPLRKAANKLRVLANAEHDAGKKSQLIAICTKCEQRIQVGTVSAYIQDCIYAKVSYFAASQGDLDSQEYKAMLVELRKLFLDPERSATAGDDLSGGAGGANLGSKPPLLPPRPKASGESSEQKRPAPSYQGNPKPFAKGRTDFLNPKVDEKVRPNPNRLPKQQPQAKTDETIGTGRRWKQLPAPKPGNKPTKMNVGAGQRYRAGSGVIGGGTALFSGADQSRLSSFYYATQKIHARLTAPGVGYKYFSLPEMKLFKKTQELLQDKEYLKSVEGINGKTIWETLNPEGADVFRVSQLVAAAPGKQKSPLADAMAEHEHYVQEFKTSLSQPGGTYKPAGKNYYFETKNGRYYLMVKGGKTLGETEMEEATRELLIITRDMTGQIDVNVRIQSAVSEKTAKDLAAIITILGATVDETKNVAVKDKRVHQAVEKHAIQMQTTAIAPEFATGSVKNKQSELWKTVSRNDVGPIVKTSRIIHEIEQSDYRLMSAHGERKMPEVRSVTGEDQRTYWTKKRALLNNPEWNYVDAGDIVTNVLRSVEKIAPSGQNAEEELSDAIMAHLIAFNPDFFGILDEENVKENKEWEASEKQEQEQASRRLQKGSSSSYRSQQSRNSESEDDSAESDNDLAESEDYEEDELKDRYFDGEEHQTTLQPRRPLTQESGSVLLRIREGDEASQAPPPLPRSSVGKFAIAQELHSRFHSEPSERAQKRAQKIETIPDGNCLLHTIVLVLKERFNDLEKGDGYREFEAAYTRANPDTSLKTLLQRASPGDLQKKLSPILRPLAVKWLFEDPELKDKIVDQITDAWFMQLKDAIPDEGGGSAPYMNWNSLKGYVDLFPPDMCLSEDTVTRINANVTEDGLRQTVADYVFPAMCGCYRQGLSNLPPEVAVAAWKKLATNIKLTSISESAASSERRNAVDLLIPGTDGKQNVEVQLLHSTITDGAGAQTGHYTAEILNTKKAEREPARASSNSSALFGHKAAVKQPIIINLTSGGKLPSKT